MTCCEMRGVNVNHLRRHAIPTPATASATAVAPKPPPPAPAAPLSAFLSISAHSSSDKVSHGTKSHSMYGGRRGSGGGDGGDGGGGGCGGDGGVASVALSSVAFATRTGQPTVGSSMP